MSEDIGSCVYLYGMGRLNGIKCCRTHIRSMRDYQWCVGSRVNYTLVAVVNIV